MQKSSLQKIFLLSVVLVFAMVLISIFAFVEKSDNTAFENSNEPQIQQNIKSPPLPDSLGFCNERVPNSKSAVLEKLDREILVNTYWHSSTILSLKKANRWFPVIEPILDENNIPDDFKYLALIESGFTQVVSPKGAAGFWQFLEKTAREYGLEVNDYVDERYHVEKATQAACKYLKDAYDEFGSWTLVAAAYNAGKRRITESVEHQQTHDYYNLYLNEETSRYVFRILAIKAICLNPELYGFYLEEKDLYKPYQEKNIEITNSVENLMDFCKEQGISYLQLKNHNPWLRSKRLPNASGKIYQIKIPVE